jgi:hypothetical protein
MLFPTLQYRLGKQIHLNLLPARHANNIETAISQSNMSVLKSLGAVMQPLLLWVVFIASLLAWVGAYYQALSLLG